MKYKPGDKFVFNFDYVCQDPYFIVNFNRKKKAFEEHSNNKTLVLELLSCVISHVLRFKYTSNKDGKEYVVFFAEWTLSEWFKPYKNICYEI